MTWQKRTFQHAFQRTEWTDWQDMEPRQQPRQGVDQTSPRARSCSESRDSRSRSPVSRSSSVESPTRDGSPVNFTAAMDPDVKRAISDDEDDEGDSRKISAAQYQIFRQAVTTSKGSFKVNPAKTKRASRASLLDLGDPEVTDRVSWLDQPSLQDTMVSMARIAQGLKDDEEVERTTLSETLNTASSTFKFFTVKQIFPREPYHLKIHRDALYMPKPPGDHGFSDNKAPSSYQMSHRTCLDTEELARRSAIYASLADSMVASPKDERSKLLREKLAIIQEAQVSAVSAGFAAASNLQLLHWDALLKNYKFQPQVLSSVRTAPFEGNHVVGPEPKVLQNLVRAIRQADRMAGSSVTFAQKNPEPTSTKVTSSKKTAPRPSVFDRLGSPTSTPQRTVTQESPFGAGTGRAHPWPFQGSMKSGKASSSTSTRQRWRVPGGGSPGRLCPALAESVGQLPGHRHRRGRGGHCIPATASAHPSKHQFSGPGTAVRTFSKQSMTCWWREPSSGSPTWRDIHDAYLHVPMHQAVRKYLRFVVNKKVYQFTCLPFGLGTSPREFTKLLRPVVSLFRQQGVKLHVYLDDWLIRADTPEQAQLSQEDPIPLFVEGQDLLTQDVWTGDGVTETRHFRPSNLRAWKLSGPSWEQRVIPGKLPTWCQGAFGNLHNKCMNPIGQDSWRSVGRKDGTCFESEVIISAPTWCTSSGTDYSHRR